MSLEHEEHMLGCILSDSNILADTTITQDHFLRSRTKSIFVAIEACRKDGVPIDYISITDRDMSIDKSYLAGLVDRVISSANWEYYEQSIKKSYMLKKLHDLGGWIKEKSEKKPDPEDIIRFTENLLLEISSGNTSHKIESITGLLPPFIDELEKRYKLQGKLPGIATGIDKLDEITTGFLKQKYYVIGARPSQGKSALMLKMAMKQSIDLRCCVGILSLESSKNEIVGRVFSARGRISGNSIRTGRLKNDEKIAFDIVGETVVNKFLYIYDRPNLLLHDVYSQVRRMKAFYNIDIVYIDYLQLIDYGSKTASRYEQISAISRGLKQLARIYDIPIVALAQLGRDSEGRRPVLSDLKESGQIEQDADTIIFIFNEQKDNTEKSQLIVAKNRDGPCEDIPIYFDREHVTFTDGVYL